MKVSAPKGLLFSLVTAGCLGHQAIAASDSFDKQRLLSAASQTRGASKKEAKKASASKPGEATKPVPQVKKPAAKLQAQSQTKSVPVQPAPKPHTQGQAKPKPAPAPVPAAEKSPQKADLIYFKPETGAKPDPAEKKQ